MVKSSVTSKCASKHLWGTIYFAVDGTIIVYLLKYVMVILIQLTMMCIMFLNVNCIFIVRIFIGNIYLGVSIETVRYMGNIHGYIIPLQFLLSVIIPIYSKKIDKNNNDENSDSWKPSSPSRNQHQKEKEQKQQQQVRCPLITRQVRRAFNLI